MYTPNLYIALWKEELNLENYDWLIFTRDQNKDGAAH